MGSITWAATCAVALSAIPLDFAAAGRVEPFQDCSQVVAQRIAAIGLKPGDITDTVRVTDRRGGNDGVFAGYQYWMRIRSCARGYLVVQVSRICSVEQTFTIGGCRIAGVYGD